MNDARFDIVVVGGGPAGTSAAIRLATAGRKVLLIEKAKFPRHKLCGEFVSPECLRHFVELGIDQDVYEQHAPKITKTVFYSVRGRSLVISNKLLAAERRHSIGLSRSMMDDLLIERAVDVGVDVRTETMLREPTIRNGAFAGLELRTKNDDIYSVHAPIAIDATGRGRILARLLEKTQSKKAPLIAFKTHLRKSTIEQGACEIYSYPGGYGGCTEIEGGLQNLCFVANANLVRNIGAIPEKAVREIVMTNSRAKNVLGQVEFVGDWYAVPISRFGRESLFPFRGVITIGDAAAFIDPFTGSGIALALESAKLASEAILSSKDFEAVADKYKSAYHAAFERRLKFCRMLRLASTSPLIAEGTIAVLAKSSFLGSLFARATRFNALGSSG